jgi:hypothetical protein
MAGFRAIGNTPRIERTVGATRAIGSTRGRVGGGSDDAAITARSQPTDRTKAYRARIISTLELDIHAHEETRDAVRVPSGWHGGCDTPRAPACALLARSFRSDKGCLLDNTVRVISGNPALSNSKLLLTATVDLSTDRDPKFALLDGLLPYKDVGKQ